MRHLSVKTIASYSKIYYSAEKNILHFFKMRYRYTYRYKYKWNIIYTHNVSYMYAGSKWKNLFLNSWKYRSEVKQYFSISFKCLKHEIFPLISSKKSSLNYRAVWVVLLFVCILKIICNHSHSVDTCFNYFFVFFKLDTSWY